jgi:hypothetical protein
MRDRSDSLILGGGVTEDFFLATLHEERDFKKERQRFRSRFGSESGLEEAFATISKALPRQLLRLSDAWIASGRNVRGLWEVPRDRKLDFYTSSCIQAWMSLHPFHITVSERNGKLSLNLRDFEYEATLIGDPDEYAAGEAVRMFLWFLNEAKLPHAIAKCAECERFYFRVKPHESYKKACFCPNCRSKASVSRRMEEVRTQKENSLIQAAIAAHNKWRQLSPQSRARFKDEKTYIVRQIGKEFGVTGNWLTRHWHQIINDQSATQPPRVLRSEGVDR